MNRKGEDPLSLDVFGFGHICLDRLLLLAPFPDKGKKGTVVRSLVTGGGPVPTALKTVAKLGLRAAFQGAVGDDEEGRLVRADLESFGVDAGRLVVAAGHRTACAAIWVDAADASRTVALDMSRSRLPEAEELDVKAVQGCRLFLTDGRATQASLLGLREARAAGALTMLDAGAPRPMMAEMLPMVDFCVVSSDFADGFRPGAAPEELAELLLDTGTRNAVVTNGARGAVWRSEGDGGWVDGFSIKPVVDTTGAGDVFHGALIYALLNRWELPRGIRFANAAAALSCRALSGSGAIPAIQEIKALL